MIYTYLIFITPAPSHYHQIIYALRDYTPSFFIERDFCLVLKQHESSKFSILFHPISSIL